MSQILNKLDSLILKINKYTSLELTSKKIFLLGIVSIVILFLIFTYFEKVNNYVKDNIIKWDNFTFIKLSILMIIPILSFIGLFIDFLPNKELNNWIHFFLLFFILPSIPYLFLCIYRICQLLILKLIKSFSKKKKVKA